MQMSNLFSEYSTSSYTDWKEKIIQNLKGKNYNNNLVSKSENIEISPIYHAENTTESYPIHIPDNWEQIQLITTYKDMNI